MEVSNCMCGCGVAANLYYKPFESDLNLISVEWDDLVNLCPSPIFQAVPRNHLQFRVNEKLHANSVVLINRYGNVIKVADFRGNGCPCYQHNRSPTK